MEIHANETIMFGFRRAWQPKSSCGLKIKDTNRRRTARLLVLNNSSSRRTCSYLQWRLARESRIVPRGLCSVKLENENRNGSLNNWIFMTFSCFAMRMEQRRNKAIPIPERMTLLSQFYLVNQKRLWITRMCSYFYIMCEWMDKIYLISFLFTD